MPNAELCGGPSGPSERAPGYAGDNNGERNGTNCRGLGRGGWAVYARSGLAHRKARNVGRGKAKQVKHTPGRLRILDAMAKPGAYARPDRSVVGLPPQIYRIKPDMVKIFTRAGFIAEAMPPKEEKTLGYVLRITDKGRDWLKLAANAALTGAATEG